MTIDIEPRHMEIVREILNRTLPKNAQVSVFGSRARHTARRGSDLDLAVDLGRRFSREDRHRIEGAFEESDLPYTVDVVDLNSISDNFRNIILETAKPLS